VKVNGRKVDHDETIFGIREVRFDPNTGFFLNGRNLKLKGVCMHHDLGSLGIALNCRALERQLEILQEMGCNAIRTSHNPPAPELLDLSDAMGFLVIDEAFDEWKIGKVDNGYHLLFDEWAEKDLRAMIKRDRNHPCVIMWSIGNEVREQRSETGAEAAKFLTEIAHDEDPTRPVTAGFNHSDPAIKHGLAAVVDIPGWNYKPFKYAQYHADHPEWAMYGSETESCVSTRGEYYFPVEEERDNWRETLQVSSYDLAAAPWGYPPDYELKAQEECPFIMGEFVWTGFDYLGEPTPYKQEWPSRSSYFGIIDLCGFPKDRYYLYQSQWSEKKVLHLLPHWNWEGREGEITPVHCYTNYEAAELFLNGRSLGIRRKNPDGLFDRYRLIWEDVRYEPGSLKVAAYDQHGQIAAEKEVKTAGSPAQILLLPDRTTISNDRRDLSFMTVKIVDDEGDLCPLADNLVQFRLNGPGEIVAVDNGDPTGLEPFIADYRRAFHGLCLLVVKAVKDASGEIRISASSENLQGSETVIVC
jgi:beta-galactosidase